MGMAAIIGYVVLAAELGEGFAIPVAIIATISAAVILRGPVGKALARRLERTNVLTPVTMASSTERTCRTLAPSDAISSISS